MDWFNKSLVAALFLIPGFFAIPYFRGHYSVRPEVTLVFYMLGIAAGVSGWLVCRGNGSALMIGAPALSITVIGLIFGSVANIMLFQAMGTAPNVGLPMAIVSTNAAIAFIITPLLVNSLPRYFAVLKFARFDKVDFSLLLVIIVCMGIIGVRR
jgi:hypothetical protein